MSQSIRVVLLLATAVTGLAAGATQYQRHVHPDERFVVECPASWRPFSGLHNANVYHPDNRKVDISIRAFPQQSEDSRTPEEYIAETSRSVKLGGGHLERKEVIQVSGRDATRLEFAEEHGLWGPASGVSVIVPDGPQYYVASLYGNVADMAVIRPQFDRFVASLRLGPAPKSLMEWGGTYDGPKEARRMVARTPEELRSVVAVFGSDIIGKVVPASGFDFSAHMLVAISMGQQPTGGYGVNIRNAIRRDDNLHVRYHERVPSQSAYVTQAVTAPFHVKVLPRSDGGKALFERVLEPGTHAPG